MADPLRIVVLSQYFTPEMGAPAARFHDFGRLLVERGHRVTLVTGLPNFPSGVVPEGYRGRLRMREEIAGIDVRRGWLYTSPRLSGATKSLSFATYAASASLQALFGDLEADVVVATSPPPTVAVPGILAARRLRAPLVFDVRDIWPEAVALSGRLRSGPLIRGLQWLEEHTYREASAVTVVTEGKRERLVERGVPAEKVHVIPNGVDLSRFEAVDPAPAHDLLRRHGVDPGRFLVVYAGVMNPPQGLDVLFDAALRLRERDPGRAARVQFVLVGDGSERERLERRRREEGLGSAVALLPIQPRDAIPPLLCAAGAIAITLRPRRDAHTVPSKLYESLASGRPVLVSADGAPAAILRESGAGFATPAADAEALADAVLRLVDDPEACRRLGERGAAFARGYDRRVLVDRFEALLARLAAEHRR